MPDSNKKLNEVDWKEVWYGEYMTRIAKSDHAPCADIDGVLKIIAETERRTWEAAKKKIESSQISICRSGELHWDDVEAAIKIFKRALIVAFEARIKKL